MGARANRLLRHVEQQASAGPLRQHDAHRALRDCLMGEEINFKTLPQHLVFDLADAALRRRARVRDHDVDAAEMRGDAVE